MSFDQCRRLIQKGLSLGMLARLHLHVLVADRAPDHPLLKQLVASGHTQADELCLALDMSEAELL